MSSLFDHTNLATERLECECAFMGCYGLRFGIAVMLDRVGSERQVAFELAAKAAEVNAAFNRIRQAGTNTAAECFSHKAWSGACRGSVKNNAAGKRLQLFGARDPYDV